MSDANQETAKQSPTFSAKLFAWAYAKRRAFYGIARCLIPIVRIKKIAFITRFADVDEVLHRDDAFGVTYEPKMRKVTGGNNFFLGMNPSPEYTRDKSNKRAAAPLSDATEIVQGLVDRNATSIVEQHANSIDVVADLARVVSAQTVEEYVGITGPDRDTLIEWTTDLFHYLFFPTRKLDDETTLKNASESCERIDQLIADRKKSKDQKDDMMGRLIRFQGAGVPGLSDVDIRNNLIGIIIGAIPTTYKATTLVLDYLLSQPATLKRAQQAARQNNITLLNNFVLESLRFNIFGPVLIRECQRDYKIAKGTWRGKTIRKGTTVYVGTESAMFDGRELNSPGRFNESRPEYQYMHYGYGMHTCFGKYINDVQIATILKSLLVKNNLKRAAGDAGQIQQDDRSFPTSMTVTYDS